MFADTLHKNFWNISTFPFHDLSRRLRADPRISVLLSVTDTNRRPGLVASTPLLFPMETRMTGTDIRGKARRRRWESTAVY